MSLKAKHYIITLYLLILVLGLNLEKQNRWVPAILLIFFLSLVALQWIAQRSPRIAKLYEFRGGRTDVRYMVRHELFSSGRSFFVGFLALLILLLSASQIFVLLPRTSLVEYILLGVLFFLMIFAGMLMLGSLYLFVRGVFRRRDYAPDAILAEDFIKGRIDFMYGRVITAHQAPSFPAAQFVEGENVRIDKRDTEWEKYLWCVHEDGRSAWISEDYLKIEAEIGELLRDYDSTELDVDVGEQILILTFSGGWYLCRNQEGRYGWIPNDKLRLETAA